MAQKFRHNTSIINMLESLNDSIEADPKGTKTMQDIIKLTFLIAMIEVTNTVLEIYEGARLRECASHWPASLSRNYRVSDSEEGVPLNVLQTRLNFLKSDNSKSMVSLLVGLTKVALHFLTM